MIDDFDGAAATVRFDDGAVEVEYAMSNYQKDLTGFVDSEEGAAMVADLPADTVAAMGFSLEEGWADAMLDYVKNSLPEESAAIDEEIARFESETGLAFPEDVETLLGEGLTMSVGSGIDPDAITNGGPGEIPAGITIKGDADEIQAVLDKISELAGPEIADYLQVTEGDGTAVLALQDDYRGKLESRRRPRQQRPLPGRGRAGRRPDGALRQLRRRRRLAGPGYPGHARGERERRAPVGLRRQRLGRGRRRARPAQGHHGLTLRQDRPFARPSPGRRLLSAPVGLSARWWRSPLR